MYCPNYSFSQTFTINISSDCYQRQAGTITRFYDMFSSLSPLFACKFSTVCAEIRQANTLACLCESPGSAGAEVFK